MRRTTTTRSGSPATLNQLPSRILSGATSGTSTVQTGVSERSGFSSMTEVITPLTASPLGLRSDIFAHPAQPHARVAPTARMRAFIGCKLGRVGTPSPHGELLDTDSVELITMHRGTRMR